ncbi:MAG: hypothetical protein GY835_02545 [bacterium]|nr:hypothetical protein [bacterium]
MITSEPEAFTFYQLPVARRYQNRPEFEQLCEWWISGGSGVCALVGLGGAGKTTIVERFVSAMSVDGHKRVDHLGQRSIPRAENLFVFSFDSATNPESFFSRFGFYLEGKDLLTSLENQHLRWSYGQILRMLEGTDALLLILDGLERFQEDGTRGSALGRIQDPRLCDLVSRIAAGSLPHLSLIMTALDAPCELPHTRSPRYHQIWIQKLPFDVCVDLLKEHRLDGDRSQLERLAETCGRHAFTLDLAAGYISRFAGGDPMASLRFPPLDRHTTEAEYPTGFRAAIAQRLRFWCVVDQYYEELDRCEPAAIALLRWMALLDGSITIDALTKLVADARDKTALSVAFPPSDRELQAALKLLIDMRLVDEFQGVDREPAKLVLHADLRAAVLRRLDSNAVIDGHDAIRSSLEILYERQRSTPGTRS